MGLTNLDQLAVIDYTIANAVTLGGTIFFANNRDRAFVTCDYSNQFQERPVAAVARPLRRLWPPKRFGSLRNHRLIHGFRG